MKYEHTNLLLEYTLILAGQKAKFGQEYFSKQEKTDESLAYEVFQMAIETFLHWSPEQALARLDRKVVEKMKLDLVMSYMKLPPECEFNDDYTWILHKLYPDKIYYSEEEHVLRIYEKILSGEKYKWPKWYFSEADGHERAYICLRHMISHNMHYETPEELYEQFVTGKGTLLMNQLGLRTVVKDEFSDPITFLYEAMFADDPTQDFLYHYYKVKYFYKKAKDLEKQFTRQERHLIG